MANSNNISRSLAVVSAMMSGIVDYAGLFPPSQVAMQEAVVNYAAYKHSNYAWMLGRFVVPAARLGEFWDSARELAGNTVEDPWRLAVLAGEDIQETIRTVKAFNAERSDSAVCDVLEVRANSESKIENTVKSLPEGVTAYFEIAADDKLPDLVSALAIRGQRAKMRTGGITSDAFPNSREVVRFVRTCTAANVPFKATAGLHHPIRCYRPLTYAEDAPKGTMHGFLNLLMMTGFARQSYRVSLLEEIMEEEFAEAFWVRTNGIGWRNDNFLSLSQIDLLRQAGFNSFGSCSFDEPIADLRTLGLL